MNQIPLVDIEAKLLNASPFTIMEFALQEHAKIAISFSGAEDVALIDIASQIRPDIQVFVWILAACILKPTNLSSACVTTIKSPLMC